MTINSEIGQRIRVARKNVAGLTQVQLAERLGITHQQLQRYESGASKVSSSRLYEISVILEVDIGFFFERIEEKAAERRRHADGEIQRITRAFGAIEDRELRSQALTIVELLARTSEK